MPVVQAGLRAGQKAVPHRCAERPFANSTVHPALRSCRIAFRTSLLGCTPLAINYMITKYISMLLPCRLARRRLGDSHHLGAVLDTGKLPYRIDERIWALPLSTLWRPFGRLREARAVEH